MEHIKKRILSLLSDKDLNVNRASAVLDIPQRTLNRQLNEGGNVSMELICAINKHFPEVSMEWILNGNGSMYRSDSNTMDYIQNISPYYDSITVSAGVRDTINDDCELSDSFISIPGMKADFFFPVVGTSMQPEINPGDIIGVNRINSFTTFESKKVYMIITRDARMIKYCSADNNDKDVVLCTSPNYPSFTIRKDEIIAMYSVVVKISNI